MPKIVQLFPDKDGSPTATSVAVAPGELVALALREPLKQMLVAADDVLFDWAKQASGDDAHICFAYMRRLRVERDKVQQAFESRMRDGVASAAPSSDSELEFDLDALSLQDDDALEEDIAIGNMANRGRDFSRDVLAELDRRARWAQDNGQLIPGLDTIQPTSICQAFASALQVSEPAITMRLVMLKLFERAVLPHFPKAFATLNRALDEAGIKVAEPPRAAMPPTSGGAAGDAHAGGGGGGNADGSTAAAGPIAAGASSASPYPAMAPGGHPLFGAAGPQSWSAAAPTASGSFGGSGFNGLDWLAPQHTSQLKAESQLAQELGELLSLHGMQHAPTPLAQRLDVVNRLFSGVRDDPMVRPELKPALDALRFPLFKAALGDRSLLTNADHPLRRLVDDAGVLATARNTPLDELNEVLSELVRVALLRLSPSAAQARKGMADGEVLPDSALSALDGQLQQSRQSRRRRLIERARDGARQVLADALPEGRRLAMEAEAFVESDLLPLLALADLNFGRDSRAYHEAASVGTAWIRGYCDAPLDNPAVIHITAQLDRALAWAQYPASRRQRALETARALLQGHPEPAHAGEVIDALDADHHIDSAVTGADAADGQAVAPSTEVAEPAEAVAVEVEVDSAGAESQPEPPPAAATPTAPPAPAATAEAGVLSLRRPPHQRIQVGSYAAVFDHKIGQTRWLRLAQRAAAARMLVFSDFCEEVTVRVRYDDFDCDVTEGRSRLL
ncbi:DUF1631 domain-containing protein [Flagellatimonas centrodinii]|uniref:DUF1631 family protein n=1 Tax=Flagellatimonas centrodinii TaxID=2806210 RepID=UPI001FEF7B14|nr:DUF1631 family protein [Flagellatimonas centrodinii]ULQ47723.1 DUF1631 domain-containing protein [Flagellatimonas centrodinii]